jgi:hypothetical protein
VLDLALEVALLSLGPVAVAECPEAVLDGGGSPYYVDELEP